MLYPLFLILALLIFALVMVVVSMRGRGRNLRPFVVSPDAARNHRALIYLIRGTGVLVASAAGLAAIYFSLHCFLGALRGELGTLGWPGVFIAIGIIAGVLGVISHAGYSMWLRVDTTSVANFAFVFAMLLAVGWYHLLPTNLPKAVIDYFGDNPFFAPFRESNPNPSYKAVLSYLAFFVFYKLIKAFVVQKLGMSAVPPPKEPPFSGSSEPSVPFNPYDLSQNKPVRPLPQG